MININKNKTVLLAAGWLLGIVMVYSIYRTHHKLGIDQLSAGPIIGAEIQHRPFF